MELPAAGFSAQRQLRRATFQERGTSFTQVPFARKLDAKPTDCEEFASRKLLRVFRTMHPKRVATVVSGRS